MCGLVGLIHHGNFGFSTKDIEIFEQMLYVDALRGEDATGVACINTSAGALVLKEAIHSAWFTYDKEYVAQQHKFVKDGKALLGHNRKATMGGRKDEHAHPFLFNDRYIFFHNGTLTNHRTIADTEVDSEALGGHLVACEGNVEALSEALSKVKGAYACVWYDADKHTVYFLRNAERPLAVIMFDNGSMAYASESWIAIGPASRNYYKVKDVKLLETNILYSINLNDTTLSLKEEAIPQKKAQPSVVHGYIPTTTGGSNTNTFLSKKDSRKYITELKNAPSVGFFLDDCICTSTAKPDETEVYDWLVTGIHEEWEGVVFKFVEKDLFKYEADGMLGRYATATYASHEYRAGVLEVWVKSVYYKRSTEQACH